MNAQTSQLACFTALLMLAGCTAMGPVGTVDGATLDASTDAAVFDGASADGVGSRGPAYAAGTASCPPSDGMRRLKLVNNCTESRWFKLDGRTTPTWVRPTTCAWNGLPCTDLDGVAQCSAMAAAMSPVDPGTVYCKNDGTGQGRCACNPHFELAPGRSVEFVLPADQPFPSGTGWLASGCNALGHACAVGNDAARNSTFEFTYGRVGSGTLYYDISAVNAWTSVSNVGMRSCGGGPPRPGDTFWCRGTGCNFDVNTECPDGSNAFPAAAAGCNACPTAIVNGKQVLSGSCGTCPNGASSNRIPTGTVFNANGVGGNEWTFQGSPDFATTFGYDEGARSNRRFRCTQSGCTAAAPGAATACLGGCDLCTTTLRVPPNDERCIKYCCPDGTRTFGSTSYRFDSAGCTALGVQAGTDYTRVLKAACPYVYTFGYEDHSSTFQCSNDASLLVQACPDPTDFPARVSP